MSFTHVAVFVWRADIDPVARGNDIAAALDAYVAGIEGVEHYWCGRDAGVTPGTSDFVVVGRFTDRAAFEAYRDHPDHQRILNELIIPALDSRSVAQLDDGRP